MKEEVGMKCGTCRFWRLSDPTGEFDNVGVCAAMTDLNTRKPFWARNVLYKTTSWEGGECRTWEAK